ncbi:MAG: FG-GAP-like repeat-containing protein [Bacteroidetes bacterium]|nr:FG-GAP-like repeat-containing protein [Bacteroidota bacterium]
MKLYLTLLSVILISISSVYSQTLNDFGFSRSYSFPEVLHQGISLPNPWVGGMNSCQFSSIDLNQDGIKDLFVFDRIGYRIMTFINQGTPDSIDYVYAPEYATKFPYVVDWVQLVDYDGDGKEDLFTYGYGGIKVFKNTSDPVNGLSFKLITNQLLSFMFTNYINIFLTNVDYPIIDDIDGDGDLDIITFWIIGTYLHYHKNLSMEKYGKRDSLDYALESQCYGYIREGDTSNRITLNAACPFKDTNIPGMITKEDIPSDKEIEHVGSTLLSLDLNADGVKDMLIGDVDYPTIIGLTNGGTPDSARMEAQDDYFPSYDTSVRMFSMPVTCYVDVNNDNVRDLLVSPFDPSTMTTESDKSVWLYLNQGADNQPLFHRVNKAFLQEGMIDVGTNAYPVAFDVDQDGRMDIVLGNFGFYDSSYYVNGFLHSVFRSRLVVYKNTGTSAQPVFSLADTDFAGLSALKITNAFPTFGDLDGDGDPDMLVGNRDGSLYYFENTAGPGNPVTFAAPVANYQGISVGNYCTPQLWDLDKDNLPDLVIGNQNGIFSYYHNNGTAQNPSFSLVTDSLGKIYVRDTNMSWDGYSVPCFFTADDGTDRLFAGSLKGGLAYFKDISASPGAHFTGVSQNYLYLKSGDNSAFAVCDFDNDGYKDLLMGNSGGGLAYFKGTLPGPVGVPELKETGGVSIMVYPNPAIDECVIDVSATEHAGSAVFEIVEPGGRRVIYGTLFTFPARINTAILKPGIYFIRLSFHLSGSESVYSNPAKLLIIR